jgi:Pyridoxamine 5'-phosphate oxidase
MDVDGLFAVQRSSYRSATRALRASWPEADALGQREMGDFLERHRYCVLATARTDGRASAAPVAFIVQDGCFWFATAPGLRLRNLNVQPWASLVVMEGNADVGESGQPHVALTAEGPVTLHPVDAWRAFEEEWRRRHSDPPVWAAALAQLRPERVFSHAARRRD